MTAYWTGKKRSPETIAKMRARRLGRFAGPDNPNWSGGRTINECGYVLLKKPGHPMAKSTGYIYEHRFVMAEHLGRLLLKTEQVHHINGVKDDNRIENLEIITPSEHTSRHQTGKKARPETREKLSRRSKERYQSEIEREKTRNAVKRFHNTPEGKAIHRRCVEAASAERKG